MTTADEFKAQGNSAFAAKDYDKAVELFTEAINASESLNHVLFSNRSGAYASLKDYQNALQDADKTVEINPTWAKGYNRRGAALHGLGDLAKAVDAYDEALKLDPSNTQAKQGKKSAEDAIAQNLGGNQNQFSLTDPANLQKLMQNPRTREYLNDPAFVKTLEEATKNPMAMFSANDPRLMDAMQVILGIEVPKDEDSPMPDSKPSGSNTSAQPKTDKPKAADPEPKVEPVTPESSAKRQADEFKAAGNALYKKRQFDEAIEQYEKAWEANEDITYLNNRSAAEFEKGDYDAAIKTGLMAVEKSHELRSDYKAVAKALARIGNSYLKQEKLKEAIEYFDKSLTEQRSPDVLTKLRSTQRELRNREEAAYFDPELSDKARNEGNALFKEGQFPESVKAYTEAIKRNPKDPRGYGNRSASFMKLMNYPDVIRDSDKAIELDPNFTKAYIRKATVYNILKEHVKAMKVLEEAELHDPENKHAREIRDLYEKATAARFAALPGETEDQRVNRLVQDPEIDSIRRDPIINTILQQAVNDPQALRDHFKNPEVKRKLNLLAAAGILRY